ncbi:hypothetical protein [Methylobacterium sp. JK268]
MADTRRAGKPERPIQHLQWECRTCEAIEGVASTMTMKVRKGGFVSLKSGRMVGGTFFEVCAICLVKGRTTIVANG